MFVAMALWPIVAVAWKVRVWQRKQATIGGKRREAL